MLQTIGKPEFRPINASWIQHEVDATDASISLIFRARAGETIQRVGARVGAVVGTPTYDARLESLDPTTKNPSRSLRAGGANATMSPGGVGWIYVTLTTPYLVPAGGEWLAVRIVGLSVTADVDDATFDCGLNISPLAGAPYLVTEVGGVFTRSNEYANISVEYLSGDHVRMCGGVDAIEDVAFDNGASPFGLATVWDATYGGAVGAMRAYAEKAVATSNFTMRVLVEDSLEESQEHEANIADAGNDRDFHAEWASPVAFLETENVKVAVFPESAGDMRIFRVTWESAEAKEAVVGDIYSAYWDGATWQAEPLKTVCISFDVISIDTEGGGEPVPTPIDAIAISIAPPIPRGCSLDAYRRVYMMVFDATGAPADITLAAASEIKITKNDNSPINGDSGNWVSVSGVVGLHYYILKQGDIDGFRQVIVALNKTGYMAAPVLVPLTTDTVYAGGCAADQTGLAANQVRLAASASATADRYKDHFAWFPGVTGYPGYGDMAPSYDADNKILTLAHDIPGSADLSGVGCVLVPKGFSPMEATAALNLERVFGALPIGTVIGSPTTTVIRVSGLVGTADQYIGRLVTILTGSGAGQQGRIADYAADGTITLESALSGGVAPAVDDILAVS